MSQKALATRAVIGILAQRTVRFIALCAMLLSLFLLVVIYLLAVNISAWWWLLLFILIPWTLVAGLVWLIARVIVKRLLPPSLTPEQASAAKQYGEKLQRLAETRGMGWPMFAFLSFRDILFYRDLRTARNTLDDGMSLKQDFQALEKLFNQ